jgi:uncharacterized phage protein (TIGR02218 family)
MTFDARETSQYGGQPLEGYRFVQGEDVWLFTSADREVTFPIGRFLMETISRGEIKQSQEDSASTLEVTLPVGNPVAALFIGEVPSSPVWLTQFRAHRGDETEAIAVFSGKVSRVSFAGSEATLTAVSIASGLLRVVPLLQMQTPCNHVLYSAECGANPTTSRDVITVTTVEGREVASADFALRADGWFNGGRLENAVGDMRFIVEHIGDTVKLLSPLPGLVSLDECLAYWGCPHLEDVCESKFNRLVAHLGWSRIPGKNPFRSRLDTPWTTRHLWG